MILSNHFTVKSFLDKYSDHMESLNTLENFILKSLNLFSNKGLTLILYRLTSHRNQLMFLYNKVNSKTTPTNHEIIILEIEQTLQDMRDFANGWKEYTDIR